LHRRRAVFHLGPSELKLARGAKMPIRELSEEEFQATFARPMRRLGIDEQPPVVVDLKEYLSACIVALDLPTTLDDIEIHHVYVAYGERHTHVLFWYGKPHTYLVLVLDNHAAAVLGHRVLELGKLYGLES
jgi:hypothetical protein